MMRVKVYRNLHKDCFSVVSVKTGKVIGHADVVELKNAQFRVQPAGRKKVLEQKRKNVHAYLVGELVGMYSQVPSCFLSEYMDWKDAYYNPYRCETFVDYHNLSPVLSADHVILHHGQISYLQNEEALVV
jgi:hypothetical protein